MKMDGWRDHLHFEFLGEHVLFPSLHLESLWKFTVASILAVIVCATERFLTYAMSKHWSPVRIRRSRLRNALWRACMHWLVTFVRLMYMLIAMTFNVGLIMVTVTTLSVGQFIIEYIDTPFNQPHDSPEQMKEPLLSSSQYDESSSDTSYPPVVPTRRSRSKPDNIYIHPSESNVARADAVAQQLGLSLETDLVKTNMYPEDGNSWELGKGRDVARALLGH